MDEEGDLIEKIKLLSDSIRKKSRNLKVGIQEREKYLETTFKPLVTPLQEISRKLETNNQRNIVSKKYLPIDINNGREEGNSSTEADENTNSLSERDEYVGEEEELEEDDDEEDSGSESGVTDQSEPKKGKTCDMNVETISREDGSENNTSILATNIGQKGLLTRKYILKMLQGPPSKRKCHVYGARVENNNIKIGDSVISIDDSDNLTIKGKTYPGSPGLFELIFKATPIKYTPKDFNNFKRIVKATNAHKKNYTTLAPIYRNKSTKYKNIIEKLFPPRGVKSGQGMSMKNMYETNIIYYSDVNKLVNRLRLLHEATLAGHTGVDNEIVALTQELRNQGYIN